MQQKFKAVIFDLDGVIAFTDKYHYLGWKRLADEMGWEFNEALNDRCRGIHRMASLQVILDHNNVEMPEEEKLRLATMKNERYRKSLSAMSEKDIYPGVIEFLATLRAEGIPTALCSSSRNARLILEILDLAKWFDVIIDGNDIAEAKPSPEVFISGASQLGMPPEACIVFEDAQAGIAAARSIGMQCIGVSPSQKLPNVAATIKHFDQVKIDQLLQTGLPF